MDSTGRLIRAARLRKKLTGEQFGEKCGGVGKGTVSRWETGKQYPDQTLVPLISRETGIPAAKLRPDLAFMFQVASRRRQRSVA